MISTLSTAIATNGPIVSPYSNDLKGDMAKAANQGKPGYDVFGMPINYSAGGSYTPSPAGPVKVSPTTLSGDKSQQISDNTQKINDINAGIAQNQTPTLAGTLERYNDNTPISAPSNAVQQTDENGNTWWTANGKNYAVGPDQGLSPEQQEHKDTLDKLQAQSDAAFAGQIAAIRQAYEALIEQQKKINTGANAANEQSLLMSGSSRYEQEASNNNQANQINYGIQQIADLTAKEMSAIAAVNVAQQTRNYEIVSKKLEEVDKIRAEKVKAAENLEKNIQAGIKDARTKLETRNNAIDNDIRTAILDARKGGATTEQLKGMQDALANHDYAAAVTAGGDSLSNASGIIGEYNFYVKDAKAHGQVPVSFQEYQTIDANRKAKVAAAGVPGASGYTPTTLTKIAQKAGQFDNEPIVKDYNTVATQINYYNQLGNESTDDVARVYAFAKVMDPGSAVRSDEYKNVQDYAQALLENVGLKAKRVFDNTGFLTDEARAFMKKTLNGKLDVQEKTYKNVYDEYGRIINKISGGNDGKDFLTDYSKGYTNTGGDIVKSEEEKTTKLESNLTKLKTTNPKLFKTASAMYTSVNSKTGLPYTVDEILQAFPELDN